MVACYDKEGHIGHDCGIDLLKGVPEATGVRSAACNAMLVDVVSHEQHEVRPQLISLALTFNPAAVNF
jgi:hypothetical protein